MSFDISLQRFRNGEAHDADALALRDALAPHLVEVAHGWNLRAGNSTAEIYGVEDLRSGFMVTHVDGIEVYDLLVGIAAQHDLLLLAPGAPAALTRAEQQQHLPDELRNDAVLVSSAAELVALIKCS